MARNKVIYGDQTLIDLTNDTVTTDKLASGYTAHNKAGDVITGTGTLEKSKHAYVYYYAIASAEGADIDAFYLGGQLLTLRATTNNMQLIAIKDDGVTESAITVATTGAAYRSTFRILQVHYITNSLVIIEYTYATSDTVDAAVLTRGISIKKDGTLVAGTAVTGGVATSATTTVDYRLLPSLLNDLNFMHLRSVTTTSTGARNIVGVRTYINTATGAMTNANSNSLNIGSNVLTYLPSIYMAPSKGGLFYRNASGVDCIFITTDYTSAVRNITLANAGDDIANIGVENHYILGLTNSGFLVTAKLESQWCIRLWTLDLTSTTNIMKLARSYYTYIYGYEIISFVDDIITFGGRGERIQIVGSNCKNLPRLTGIVYTYYRYRFNNNYFTSGSDPYEGVFIEDD